ncbi:MAG: serine/threonine protein kinase [Deltaproteobacteria bacterium]|nr:serine/threonine protein kinase [Deltaproteobacteria bacterium]
MGLEGTTLGGKYRLIRQIGAGGMGRVFEAVHEQTERTVAIKLLSPEAAQHADTRVRFDREARAAGRIGHDNICEVIDVGFGENDVPYIVMPLLRGSSLGNVIRREGRLSLRRAVDVSAQILAALGAAHTAGVVHRDLKPDNVFLVRMGDREDFVKVLDFGISKIIGDQRPDATLTQTGTILGTPYYMSPEQARGMKDLDARVDVYAMGAILYQMLTGKPPFDGDSYNQLLGSILLDDFPRPTALRPDVPPALEELILRATEKDREKRPRDASEMREALLVVVTGTSLRPSDPLAQRGSMITGETLPLSSTPASAPGTPATPSGWAPTPTPALAAAVATPAPGSRSSPVGGVERNGVGPATPPPASPSGGEGGALSASRGGHVVLAETGARPRRASPLAWAAAGIAVVAAAAVAIWIVGRGERGGDGVRETTSTAAVTGQTKSAANAGGPGERGGEGWHGAHPGAGPVPLEPVRPVVPIPPRGPGVPATREVTTDAGAPPLVTDAGVQTVLADGGDEAPAPVRITLEGVPAKAEVRVDGEEWPGSVIELPRGDREARIEVRARGFEVWSESVSLAGDATLRVELRRSAERPARDGGVARDGGGSIPAFGEGP